jgi:DUF4097 and DUF4098 domain-containing protein YvlB
MKTMKSQNIILMGAFVFFCAAILVATPGCNNPLFAGEKAKFKETRTNHIAHATDQALDVRAVNGSIQVWRQDRKDVKIVAHVKATTDERLKATEVVAVRADDGKLMVSAKWPDNERKSSEGCSFEIRMPDADGLVLKSSNGRLRVEGFDGAAHLRTSNGGIEIIKHVGPIDVRTSNGGIVARDIKGEVKTKTSNGAITIQQTKDSSAPVYAESSNGAITLELGEAFVGELDLKTSNSKINTKGLPESRLISSGKNHITLQFGDSDQKSRVKTSNGAITVSVR